MSGWLVMQDDEGEADRLLVQDALHSPLARDALVRRLKPRVDKLARVFLRNQADADDAAQAAMLDILHATSTFRGESRLEAWADRIAVRNAIRLARARRLASVRTAEQLDPDQLAFSCEPSSADELPRSLLVYLDALPEVRRTVLVLRHVLGYSMQEVAELTGVSVNTVKDRLLTAREEMRRMVRRDVNTGHPPQRRQP